MWNCIEDRIDDGTKEIFKKILKRKIQNFLRILILTSESGFLKIQKYGRIIRKFIFGEIFADRTAVLSSNPIPRGAMKHLKVRFLRF